MTQFLALSPPPVMLQRHFRIPTASISRVPSLLCSLHTEAILHVEHRLHLSRAMVPVLVQLVTTPPISLRVSSQHTLPMVPTVTSPTQGLYETKDACDRHGG